MVTLLHIDTDLGVDDALALFVASRLQGVRIVALSTVFGNVPLSTATRNARLMRHLLPLNANLPILTGASGPFGSSSGANATAVHGEDGMGGATAGIDPQLLAAMSLPSPVDADLKVRISSGPPGHIADGEKIILVGLGPATNLPALAAWYGEALSGIVLLSGVYFDRGNVNDTAEFNAFCDPHALAATLALDINVTIIPLDLCRKVLLAGRTIRRWPVVVSSPATDFLAAAHEHYISVYRKAEGIDGCFPHDTIAVLAACRPASFFALHGVVTVGQTGVTRMDISAERNVRVFTGGELGWLRLGLENLLF